MTGEERPLKSTGRKAFERRWRLAQAEAKRPKAGCVLTLLACLTGVLFTLTAVWAASTIAEPAPGVPTYPPAPGAGSGVAGARALEAGPPRPSSSPATPPTT